MSKKHVTAVKVKCRSGTEWLHREAVRVRPAPRHSIGHAAVTSNGDQRRKRKTNRTVCCSQARGGSRFVMKLKAVCVG